MFTMDAEQQTTASMHEGRRTHAADLRAPRTFVIFLTLTRCSKQQKQQEQQAYVMYVPMYVRKKKMGNAKKYYQMTTWT